MRILKDYQGRDVRLTEERIRHILEHPEMATLEAALEETLRRPQYVIQSQVDPAAELSYRYFIGTRVGDKWLCVVVQYDPNDAFVVTGYLTDRVKRGAQLWPSK
jgi:hypothetical protein